MSAPWGDDRTNATSREDLFGSRPVIPVSAQPPSDELRRLAPRQLHSLTEMLRKESDRQGRFQCHCCGFLSHSYLWQCPGCGQWDTYPTVRVQDLAAMKK